MKFFFFLFSASLLLAACAQKPAATATLILFNGNIFTADSLHPRATAIAVGGERILAVGSDDDIKKLAGPKTDMTDLQGAFVMPGFIEGHGHFSSLGRSLLNLNLLHTQSWQEITGMVAEKVKTAKPGDWIEGRGWHQEKWTVSPGPTVNGYPYHESLSAVSPDNPVVLYHASGHGLIANEKAMQLSGVSRETPDPVGGRIVRDAKGNLTGVFEENAMDLIEKPFAAWKNRRSEEEYRAEFDKTVELATRECLSKGITSFQDAGSDFREIEQYRRLADAGLLGLRLWVMIAQPDMKDLPKLAAFPQIGLGNHYLTVRAVKAYFDGALGSYGAWLLAPYADKPDSYGQNTTPVENIEAIAAACRQHGLQCCVHAIGDRANRVVLDEFEAALKEVPSPDHRFRIEHAQIIHPEDIPRFAQLGVVPSMQASHQTSDMYWAGNRLGPQRLLGAYAWRSLLNSGVVIPNGSDLPVEKSNPLISFHAAISRQDDNNWPAGGWYPEQRMTRDEALKSMTIWAAWAAFMEKEVGSLEAGKYADFVVLDQDIMQVPAELVLKTNVLSTWVAGKAVYRREGGSTVHD